MSGGDSRPYLSSSSRRPQSHDVQQEADKIKAEESTRRSTVNHAAAGTTASAAVALILSTAATATASSATTATLGSRDCEDDWREGLRQLSTPGELQRVHPHSSTSGTLDANSGSSTDVAPATLLSTEALLPPSKHSKQTSSELEANVWLRSLSSETCAFDEALASDACTAPLSCTVRAYSDRTSCSSRIIPSTFPRGEGSPPPMRSLEDLTSFGRTPSEFVHIRCAGSSETMSVVGTQPLARRNTSSSSEERFRDFETRLGQEAGPGRETGNAEENGGTKNNSFCSEESGELENDRDQVEEDKNIAEGRKEFEYGSTYGSSNNESVGMDEQKREVDKGHQREDELEDELEHGGEHETDHQEDERRGGTNEEKELSEGKQEEEGFERGSCASDTKEEDAVAAQGKEKKWDGKEGVEPIIGKEIGSREEDDNVFGNGNGQEENNTEEYNTVDGQKFREGCDNEKLMPSHGNITSVRHHSSAFQVSVLSNPVSMSESDVRGAMAISYPKPSSSELARGRLAETHVSGGCRAQRTLESDLIPGDSSEVHASDVSTHRMCESRMYTIAFAAATTKLVSNKDAEQPALSPYQRQELCGEIEPDRSAAHFSVPSSLPLASLPLALTVPVSNADNIDSTTAGRFGAARRVDPLTVLELIQKDVTSSERTGEGGKQLEQERTELRQHSTADLVSIRRGGGQPWAKVELFEDDDSDSASTGGVSVNSNKEEKRIDTSIKDSTEGTAEWLGSIEGKSRLAHVAKSTLATDAASKIRTSKYLKLFAPTGSAHDTYPVLAAVHRKMNGTGWARRGGWGSYLIRKSRAELDAGRVYGITSVEGSVRALVLSCNNVCGRIPASIARLESLKCINFSDNHISGSIPAELGLLLQLHTLQLQRNNLRDHISPLLGSLISLVRLALGHNRLTGPVPDSLGNLIHLKVLSIEDNHLSGAIPTFVCRLPELEIFNASNNQLEGEIPTAIGQLSMLKKLDLGNNLLTGEMPTSLCCLRFLNWLRLDSNRLTGPVPAQFGNLVRLVVLNLSYNRLCGPVPDVIGILPGLIAVILRENLFQGLFTLVAEGNTCSRRGGVRTLDLAFNQLNEPFPDMRGLQDLQTLVMNDNRLHGSIGQEFGHVCPNLLKLHLQNNKLAGEIPESVGNLTKLEVLDLSDNRFEGSLPASLASLVLLRTLSASNNELSGDLPSFWGSFTMLTTLALNGNHFEGSIPRELGRLTSLECLYLERNHLVGSIPGDLSNCLSLKELYLHQNKLWGKIPDSLRKLVNLRYLYLYQNRLTGTVPEWFAELQQLRGLVIGENRLRGPIPWQLGHLHKLEDLYLNDNNLEGGIPERMVAHCERLQRLCLGGNRLSGRVPRSLRHVQDLRELNIENNNFHGELPIPLFLKTSLGPEACGLRFGGNSRIVDSREHFASTVAGIRGSTYESHTTSPTASSRDEKRLSPRQQQDRGKAKPRQFPLSPGQAPEGAKAKTATLESKISDPHSSSMASQKPWMGTSQKRLPGTEKWDKMDRPRRKGSEESVGDLEVGDEDEERPLSDHGDDRGGVGRPWENGEDVFYFVFKVVVGCALAVFDYLVAARLYTIGCLWGGLLVIVWKLLASVEGVLATRRLGYGTRWLSLAAVGFALPVQARRCFYHSCESDLFQVLQQVEWRWHAMMQMATQTAAALACWDTGATGFAYLGLAVVLKALVVGVVSMQRLDDKRLLRAWGYEVVAPTSRAAALVPSRGVASALKDKMTPWLRDSAWPRLILVGFHVAEVGERTLPFAFLVAALGDWGYLAPVAMVPGMFMRHVARRRRVAGRGRGIISGVKSALGMALALDSAFGAGSSVHVLAAIATTAETIAFTYVASQMSREYSEAHADAFLSTCTAMLVYTWLVGILEMVVPLGGEPKRVMPPPPPRLILKRPMNPGITNKIATNSSRVYVQSECSIADSIDSVEEDRSAWKVGRKNLGSVVPTEAL